MCGGKIEEGLGQRSMQIVVTQKNDNADRQQNLSEEHDNNDLNVEKASANQQNPDVINDYDTHVESRMATAPLKKNQDVMDFDVDDHTASVDE